MELSFASTLLITLLFFIVALLYSSVGHGGASGYLAVLSFFVVSTAEMSTTALILNLVVAGTASVAFLRAKHFSMRLTLPFILTSIPTAFLGGWINVSHRVYGILLAMVLLLAASRLMMKLETVERAAEDYPPPRQSIALPVGGLIGLVSGIVGVGGGIFLSPLIMLMGWANAKRTAATSAVFILINSLAGLGGRAVHGSLGGVDLVTFMLAAFVGGILGSRLGALRFSNLLLRRLLAVVLLIAAVKLFVTSL